MLDDDKLTPAHPHDLAEAIAFALRYSGKKRVHRADEYMAQIAAERIVEHLERARFVVMTAARRSFGAWPGLRGLIDPTGRRVLIQELQSTAGAAAG
jgi:hypothetical protein